MPDQSEANMQTSQMFHFANFSCLNELTQAQALFLAEILDKMSDTGLSDVVEWKKPKIETFDQETNTDIKVLKDD